MINLLLKGTGVTLLLWLCSSSISFFIGLLLGIVRCAKLRIFLIGPLADMFSLILRGVPLYAQLLIMYFLLQPFILTTYDCELFFLFTK